jgi:small subunit ribosomal protein S8
MSMTDPIANMLNIMRNAIKRRLDSVEVPASKLAQSVLAILKESGYIDNFRLMEDKKQGMLKIYLKYVNRKSAIIGLKKISKPGLRVYAKKGKVPQVLHGLGTAVISTSKGVMTDTQAREQNTGGEVICYIW